MFVEKCWGEQTVDIYSCMEDSEVNKSLILMAFEQQISGSRKFDNFLR